MSETREKRIVSAPVDVDLNQLGLLTLDKLIEKYGGDCFFTFECDYDGFSVRFLKPRLETDLEFKTRIEIEDRAEELRKKWEFNQKERKREMEKEATSKELAEYKRLIKKYGPKQALSYMVKEG